MIAIGRCGGAWQIAGVNHWLIKSEPDVFSLVDLKKVEQEPWSGVRNYQARNFMWRQMRVGDLALFYHSNAVPPGVVGVARVVSEPYADETQFDPASEYFDGRASELAPRWWLVDFAFEEEFLQIVTLERMRREAVLQGMAVLQKGTRLSITPVEKRHFDKIVKWGRGL
jgi:predicted RNA-binding protein with PUA-like domain